MPRWLRDRLIGQGILTPQGLTKTAKLITHRPCRTPCLAGIDDNGLDTWCDLAELNTAGEVHALLDGRSTYNLCLDQLCHRGAMRVTGTPAGDPSEPTFAEHRCHQPIPSHWTVPPPPTIPTPPPVAHEGIPF